MHTIDGRVDKLERAAGERGRLATDGVGAVLTRFTPVERDSLCRALSARLRDGSLTTVASVERAALGKWERLGGPAAVQSQRLAGERASGEGQLVALLETLHTLSAE